jgi:hypothetical protein
MERDTQAEPGKITKMAFGWKKHPESQTVAPPAMILNPCGLYKQSAMILDRQITPTIQLCEVTWLS